MKTAQNTIPFFSIVLSIIMGILYPVQVCAQTVQHDYPQQIQFNEVKGNVNSIGNIIAELEDERTERSKVFLLDDGTKMLAEYNEPIHYLDEKGEWMNIDNSLVIKQFKATQDEVSSDCIFTNKAGNFDVLFSKKAHKDNMVSMSSDDYAISWGFDNVNSVSGRVLNKKEDITNNEKFTTLNEVVSEIVYEDVFSGVNLQYFITPTGVKENIVLKDSNVSNKYYITYQIHDMIVDQIDDYTIVLKNNNSEEVYRINAPYMTDANGDVSTQLQLQIISQENEELKVCLIADYGFIHSFLRAFPITIDPEITSGLYQKMGLTACTNNTVVDHPPYQMSSDSFIVFTMSQLPEINSFERIVSAKINFAIDDGSFAFSSENDDPVIINMHPLATVSGTNITYDNQIIDYDSLSYEDNGDLCFDITKQIREWYSNGDDYDAVVLEAFNTVGNRHIYIKDSTHLNQPKPAITYIYKDYSGVDSNMSYHTFEVGQDTSVSVSDYLGNLLVTQNIFQGTGSRLPLSVSMTYNSLHQDELSESGLSSGKGWHLSTNQYFQEAPATLASQGYDYIYTDSDGSKRFFRTDDNISWFDDSGYGMELTLDNQKLYLNKGGITQEYELPSTGGKIISERDTYDNTIQYSYDNDGFLSSVSDGSGRSTSFSYTTDSLGNKILSSVLPYGMERVYFYYSSDNYLTSIRTHYNLATQFSYNSQNQISSINDFQVSPIAAGKGFSFTYDSDSRVNCVSEKGTDGTQGNYLNISYGDDNTTEFTDRQGRTLTYTFNNSGELVSVLNDNGYVSKGTVSGLTLSGGAESYTKNILTQSFEQISIGSNSSSYYYKVNAAYGNTTSSGGTVTIDKSSPSTEFGQVQFIGDSSIKIDNPTSTNHSAFYTCATHQINTTEFNNQDVTFSTYVKTNNLQQIYSGGAVGACIRIKCVNSSGSTLLNSDSIGIIGTEDWQRLSVSCHVPATTAKIRLYCMVKYASGTAWFDCLQLEQGNSASDFNVLMNSDFSTNTSPFSDNRGRWKAQDESYISVQNGNATISGASAVYNDIMEEAVTESTSPTQEIETVCCTEYETVPYDYINTRDTYGNDIKTEQGFVTRMVKKTYEVTETTESTEEGLASSGASNEQENEEEISLGNRYIYQEATIGRAGVIFNIVGEAKADSVPLSNENRTFGVALNVYYENDETPEIHYQEFNAYTDQNQSVCMSVYPYEENKVIERVAFAFVYGYNSNIMTVNNAMLNVALSSYSSDTGSASGDDLVEDEDDYIDYEVLSEAVDKNQTYMETSTVYDSTGNYVIEEIDEAGNTVTYTYNTSGNTTSLTDGAGKTTNYTYNSEQRLTSISSGNSANSYSYSGAARNIASITHNSFSYSFNYDIFDNLIASKVGNITLSSNTYSSNNGNLLRTDYANGDYVTYTYDDYDNLIELAGENGTIAQFVYNKKGLISKCVDTLSNLTTYYYYDFEGNITGEYRQSADGSLSYYLSIDSDGNQVEKTSVNGQTRTITSGTDSDGNSFTNYDGVTIESESDDFGRTTQVETAKNGLSDSFITEYVYADGSAANSTTNYVSTLTQKYGNTDLVEYEYDYNANGDITSVYEDGVKIAQYSYDNLNQLSWYADKNTGIYKSFSYDYAGNITEINEYTLLMSPWRPGSLLEQNTYSYNDSIWKDKLTSFNSDTITYDSNGNPLNYRDGMSFTWSNGRQLDIVTVDNTTITMKYDYKGLRTKKGSIKYYYDRTNNLIGMVNGNHTLLFYYDDSDNPTAFSYNGTMFFYIKNLQGDVEKIVNQNGNVIANYTYDAWGKLLSVTDSVGDPITSQSSIALLNPLRYRGYVYDNETGLYYLQSRYYDPTTCRFLNADMYVDTGSCSPISTNMYAYCENASSSFVDKDGLGKTYISAAPKATAVVKNAIANSKLDTKSFSVKTNQAYNGKTNSNGYEIHKFTKMGGTKILYQSEYYIMKKSYNQWVRYADSRWGKLKKAVKGFNSVCELFSFYSQETPAGYYIALGSTIGQLLTNDYVPSKEKKLFKQLNIKGNRSGDYIYVCMKVVNKVFSISKDKKTKKDIRKCFHTDTYNLL